MKAMHIVGVLFVYVVLSATSVLAQSWNTDYSNTPHQGGTTLFGAEVTVPGYVTIFSQTSSYDAGFGNMRNNQVQSFTLTFEFDGANEFGTTLTLGDTTSQTAGVSGIPNAFRITLASTDENISGKVSNLSVEDLSTGSMLMLNNLSVNGAVIGNTLSEAQIVSTKSLTDSYQITGDIVFTTTKPGLDFSTATFGVSGVEGVPVVPEPSSLIGVVVAVAFLLAHVSGLKSHRP